MDVDVLCNLTHPLGSFLTEFEHDPDGDWNLLELSPLREILHSNHWKQPALEQAAGDFLRKKFDSGNPLQIYVAFRIWNDYLIAREPRQFQISSRLFGSVPSEETRLDLWYPDNQRTTECVAAYTSFYPLVTYYLNRLNDGGLYFRKCKVCGHIFLAKNLRYELCSDKCRKKEETGASKQAGI